MYSLSSLAQDSGLGCCINPGSGLLACATETLSQISQCCPQPEAENLEYYNTDVLGPENFDFCNSNYFFPGQSCDAISQCQLGCCCSGLSGEVKVQAQCTGESTEFHLGETDCNSICDVPQCNDGIDNDNNGCADFPTDFGCESLSDSEELGGTCAQASAPNCENTAFVPKILKLKSSTVKGQKQVQLEWENECSSTLSFNNVYRCEGSNCNNFEQIGTATARFVDEDNLLKFDVPYTYKIEAHHSVQTATPFTTTAVTLGNLECWNKFNDNNFCIHENYYNQYRDYLIRNEGISDVGFIDGVRSSFSENLNKAFFCTDENLLKQEGTACLANQVCVVSNNEPRCIAKSDCKPEQSNIFGLFHEQQSCEQEQYCFYDRSSSLKDSCFACSPEMSCIDYKSRSSCERNNCNTGSCAWKSISDELGVGICVEENSDNCVWCDTFGTEGIENKDAASSVFEQCTEQKANLLSTENDLCYYDGAQALNCRNVVCTSYQNEECNPTTIRHDSSNNPQPTVSDKCGLNICQNFNGGCKKNADGNQAADCSSQECENDVFAPNTTIIPVIDRGKYKSLSIQIFDKIESKGSSVRRTATNYKTFICKEPCGSLGHPYDTFTNSQEIIISNLDLFDSITGSKIVRFSEGTNNLKYYSQDPTKNIGTVKIVEVIAHADSTGPLVFQFNITNGKEFNNIVYTNSKNPVISVEFFEESIVTSARLILKGTEIAIVPDFSNIQSKKAEFIFPREINTGQYIFEVNAKNSKGIFMDEPFLKEVVVDNKNPELVLKTPSDGEVVTSPTFSVTLTFDKKVNLETIKINDQDLMEKFSTIDNLVFTANLDLADGNKIVELTAKDFSGNSVSESYSFVVNSRPVEITLTSPSFGVSPEFTFDLLVETDNDAACRYSLGDNLQFEFMNDFEETGSTQHKISSFNQIPSGSNKIHKLYVRCNDPLHGEGIEVFDLSVDTNPPAIISAFASPNPIVEEPRETTLKTEVDKESICKYSKDKEDYELMELTFDGFENSSFNKINKKKIGVSSDGAFSFFVACMAKSELTSDTKKIDFESNIALPMTIISHTPDFSNSTTITLSIETNKKTQCKFSDTDPQVSQGTLMGPSSYAHTKELLLKSGRYSYYVVCRDFFLKKWSDSLKVDFTLDTTAPIMGIVDDTSTLPEHPEFTWRQDSLRAKWLATENETQVNYYEYTLEESGTLNTLINWTISSIENEWSWITKKNSSLNLIPGSKYFFRARSTNIVGLTSDILQSDGITIDPSLKPTDCSNNLKEPQETDIDCGGPCDLCGEGKLCGENSDCLNGFCTSVGICKAPSCDDEIRNQGESDIDCGGSCDACTNTLSCNVDSDCASNFCSFGTCQEAEACQDKKLTGTETDVDCGGACPEKCAINKNCNSESDCRQGLMCISGKCDKESTGEKDTDGDGIPDKWELREGLDPNDPTDAGLDFDDDGLTNIQEYTFRTNPNNSDTDSDGYSDKKEIDKSTDPLDPESKPKGILGTIFLVLVLLGIISGAAFGAYYYYENYMSKPKLKLQPSLGSRPVYTTRRLGIKKVSIPKKNPARELFRKKEEEKKTKREKVFDVFGSNKQKTKEVLKSKERKPIISPSPYVKQKEVKTKDNTFSKLTLISKKDKISSSNPAKEKEIIKKLRKISKKKSSVKKKTRR